MPILVYYYTFLQIFLYLISCSYIHVLILSILHCYKTYKRVLNHLILLLTLIVIGVLYDFLIILHVFDGLIMVVWTTQTGNHFNIIVI